MIGLNRMHVIWIILMFNRTTLINTFFFIVFNSGKKFDVKGIACIMLSYFSHVLNVILHVLRSLKGKNKSQMNEFWIRANLICFLFVENSQIFDGKQKLGLN